MAAKVAVRPLDGNNLNHQLLAKKLLDVPSVQLVTLLGVSGNNAQINLKNIFPDLVTITDLAYTVSSAGHQTSGKLPSPGTLQPGKEVVLNVPLTSQLTGFALGISFHIRLFITASFGPVSVCFEIDVHN